METTKQPHRQMLLRICTLGRVAGWTMIVLAALGIPGTAYAVLVAHIGIGMRGILGAGMDVVGQTFMGLVALGVVQFIRYVIEEGTEPRWLLRNGHIILCLFALYLFLTSGWRGWPMMRNNWDMAFVHLPEPTILLDWLLASTQFGVMLLLVLLPAFTKALCVLGIAVTLRAVLPIMAESKTLA